MTDRIKILFANNPSSTLNLDDFSDYDVEFVTDLNFINNKIASFTPHIIISFGDLDKQVHLLNSSLSIRKKWVHLPSDFDSTLIFNFVDGVFMNQINDLMDHIDDALISVITPTYNSSNLFLPYRSLLSQTYKNWERIIYDDGSSDEKTLNMIDQIALIEPRVRVIKANHSGSIGNVKHNAFMAASGKYLVELDHDDELTPWCLSKILEAFCQFPDAGFAYTDCAEVIGDDHLDAIYPDGWGFGYGSYRTEEFRGRTYQVTNYPSINSKTVRHIVGMPNHARCWTKEFYNSIYGHNQILFVADDYDLCVRTFLNTKMIHIQSFGYLQYHHGNNTQTHRNSQIQKIVSLVHRSYEHQIHNRFLELGVDDFIWRDGILDWSMDNPEQTPIANYIYS